MNLMTFRSVFLEVGFVIRFFFRFGSYLQSRHIKKSLDNEYQVERTNLIYTDRCSLPSYTFFILDQYCQKCFLSFQCDLWLLTCFVVVVHVLLRFHPYICQYYFWYSRNERAEVYVMVVVLRVGGKNDNKRCCNVKLRLNLGNAASCTCLATLFTKYLLVRYICCCQLSFSLVVF